MSARTVNVWQVFVGIAAALALLYFLRAILIPFVVAFVLVVLVNSLVSFIQRGWRGAPRWAVSLVAAIVVIGAASAGILVMARGVSQIVAQGPALMMRLDQVAVGLGQSLHLARPLHLDAITGQVSAGKIAGMILSSMQGFAAGLLLMIVYFGFILAGWRRIGRKIDYAAGSSKRAAAIKNVIDASAANIQTYMWVQTVTGAILTASAAIVMAAVGLNNVLFWTVIFFLLTFIPNIGITIGSIAPSLFALIQFPTVWQGLTIFGVTQVVATIVGNFVYPRMQAETQNIDPVVTLLSLSFWTVLWGLAGAFLAVPLTLMLMMVFAQFEGTRWVAAMLSNDGKPIFPKPPPD